MSLLVRTPHPLAPPSNSDNFTGLRSFTCKPIVRISKTGSSRSTLFRDKYCVCMADPQPAKIGKKWMEYQGRNDWEGLLDPLDHTLRLEILRYGEFVEAAYRSFDFDPSSPTYGTCKYPRSSLLAHSGIPETGYRLTRNLRATCGVQLPRWAGMAPGWMSTRSSWIGYVAVCQDRSEIQRLGRRDVVIALRGTSTCLEWIENLRATLTCLHDHHDRTEDDTPMVESGFLRLYTSRTANFPSLRETIREEIARVIETYGNEPLSLTITGHSLGAALATLAAYDISSTLEGAPMVTVMSFGGPRVGNRSFRRHLEKSGTKILRIVNSDDLVTRLPGFVVEDGDTSADERSIYVAGMPRWFQKSVQDARWVYADVGQELRLSSRESPYLREGNMATCHELKTYLHLVNGFVSSTCPFKSTAKKMLSMHCR
ncbi:phospholipase A(1) DAD1, chloroplastic-like [Rhodamnia argentea]|uniref:Phospholipase A(1) DAD1, chloroplastic-like n=1 Tax=Rhodamnia argentea TaxID=178133 RepID=A0A8B8N052_9MYRT|nr:phospholipase A(1) DAD1, chloroplastic-like [Rhodamnia argentea]